MVENELTAIRKDMVVTMDYRLEVDGNEIDSGPIQFLQGYGNIIPGLESEVEGMTLGEEKAVMVKAENAYGNYDPELEREVPRNKFPEDFEIILGRPMRMQIDGGQIVTGVAMAISDETVTINFNHPLAGKDLLFQTKVMDLRPATEIEMEQGYLSGSCGGCTSDCSEC
jgi:FKBP-type peptidyl-prolyl cis-trans isomerase SlyD